MGDVGDSDQVPTFPFGAESTPRPPRRPRGAASAFVLGVYPSAVHVRWILPTWAEFKPVVGALAVADEPTVFWDGADADDRVTTWMREVNFRVGDGPDQWGHVSAAGNGTSGRAVRDHVLVPLGIDVDDTWFTDAVDRYFLKRGGKTLQQGDRIDDTYQPFAVSEGLPAANLPRRPTPKSLIAISLEEHRDRLRGELVEAAAPIVVTLGEEARQVLAGIADDVAGRPTAALSRATTTEQNYGEPGEVRVGQWQGTWFALAHPGNRDLHWKGLGEGWVGKRRTN